MLTWTGMGWLGVIFIGLAFYGSHRLFGDSNYLEQPLAALLVLVASAVPTYAAGRFLNRDLPPRFLDNQNGGAVGHTFLFIRLEWAWLVALVPIVIIVIEKLAQ